MTSVIWWCIIYSATAAIWSNVCVLHVYKHPLSLLYPGRWVSQCSFLLTLVVDSRRGLGLYIEFRKISSAPPPYSPDTATIRLRSYLTKPKQEILVWDACREAEHSCRRRALWACLLASHPPRESAICSSDQVSPRRKYGWEKGSEVSYRSGGAELTREPPLGVKEKLILSHSVLSSFSPLAVISVLAFHMCTWLLVTSFGQ